MSKAFFLRFLLLAAAALCVAGCTVHQSEAPELAGPSEFALSFKLAAMPDAISQDGGSQSSIVISAFDANGKPRPAVTFRLVMMVDGQPTDYGTLTGKTLVTGSDGRATTVYTAPPAAPVGTNLPTCPPSIFSPSLPGGCIQIVATPVGSGFAANITQAVDIHLVPIGVILPPAATPTASFTITPATPDANTPVQFDASASCAGSTGAGACASTNQTIVSYDWEFSDGGTASGKVVSHSFPSAQTYSVTLTVVNDRGVRASSTRQVTVGVGLTPTAAFLVSPAAPVVGAQVFFDASDSRAGVGHTIVGYKWNWGDGETSSVSGSPLQDHDYQSAGTYKVVLTVTDEAGQIGTTSKDVPIVAGALPLAPTPIFQFSPTAPKTGTFVNFNASQSTAAPGRTITTYSWSWGDGTTPGSGVTATHPYANANTYVVSLTVTDNLGQSATANQPVTVVVP